MLSFRNFKYLSRSSFLSNPVRRRFIHHSMTVQQNGSANYEQWTKKDLINKIIELEKLHNDGCTTISSGTATDIIETEQLSKKTKRELTFTEDNTRLIGLKFAYAGWNYQGLAIQKEETPLPTIEQKILEALYQVKMIPSTDVNDCNFSRCGRTDKGVSAMNQVISLKVRSNLTSEQRQDPANDAKELDYVNILNQVVPEDIRFHAVCLRPPVGFDARFSCRARHYKYIFNATGLDTEAMNTAAQKFVGVHDFRNFCKVDGSKQITNFEREILSAKIEPLRVAKTDDSNFYIFDLKGRAFLWHQVRHMVAILLMVGQKLESADIVTELMDVAKYPRKPQYIMANDLPLILYDCEFDDDVDWIPTQVSVKTSRANNNFKGAQFEYNLKSVIFDIMGGIAVTPFDKEIPNRLKLDYGDGKGRYVNKNVPIAERGTVSTPEEVNEKWRMKNIKRKNGTDEQE